MAQMQYSPRSVVTGRERVPTVSLVWASTHHYSTSGTVPIQITTTGVGPVVLGKAGLEFIVEFHDGAEEMIYSPHSTHLLKFRNKKQTA